MDIEKINEALIDDNMNSAIGIVFAKLEEEGYKIKIANKEITSNEIFEGEYEELEKQKSFDFTLIGTNNIPKRYRIEFVDYHVANFNEIN